MVDANLAPLNLQKHKRVLFDVGEYSGRAMAKEFMDLPHDVDRFEDFDEGYAWMLEHINFTYNGFGY